MELNISKNLNVNKRGLMYSPLLFFVYLHQNSILILYKEEYRKWLIL